MTEDDQVIALAKLDGYDIPKNPHGQYDGQIHRKNAAGDWSWFSPGYLNDLNAIHALLKNHLPIDRYSTYRTMLGKVCARDHKRGECLSHDPIFASAKQHSEAILRVLELWQD